jgi:VWFA-related protein
MLTRTRLALCLLLPWFSAVVSAQQNPPPPPGAESSIRLDVVVTPKSGAPVTGLEQKDFTLLDNKAQQPITSFKAVSGATTPVEVVLFIDAVNTGYQTIAYERDQIDRFLRANGGHLSHPIRLAIFTDAGAKMQQGFSTDGNALATSLDEQTVGLRSITRSAGFYGAVDRFELSMRALQQLAEVEAPRPGRKLILWVSPGWPLLSGSHVQIDSKQEQTLFNAVVNLSTQLRQARIILYNVNPLGAAESQNVFYYEQFVKGVTKPNQISGGNLALQVLAVQTGGLVLNSSNDVAALLQQAFADTDAWYEISFEPAKADRPDEYHHLEVRIDKPGLIARTRQGYYAQP